MKVKALVKEAMQEINAIAYNEEPKAPDTYFCLRRLNMLLDALKADKLVVNHVTRAVYTLAANQASYTIGHGATWDGARPQNIVKAGFISLSVPSDPLEIPIRIYTDEEWAAVSLKAQTSTMIWGLWYETQFTPYGLIWTRPIMSESAQIALYVPTPIDEVTESSAGLEVDLLLPPGYRRMLITNLALEITDGFEKPPTASLISKASLSMTVVKRSNIKVGHMRLPAALLRRARRGYNILTN